MTWTHSWTGPGYDRSTGEAIYDTRPWTIFGEGPTKVETGHHSEKNNKESGPEDFRFTTKGKTLYATALGWPKDGKFNIKSLSKNNPNTSKRIKSVEFISGKNDIKWKQTSKGLSISVDGQKPCEAAYVFRIGLE